MYLPAKPCAIGPSNLHDWDYEKWSARADARDAALESFKRDWEQELTSDQCCKIYTKIDEVMTEAMSNLCFNSGKCECFNRLLFKLWAGGTDCINQIRAMLETEMNGVMEHEFEKGTDRH